MKLGYPCINRSIGCSANSTFRLANYSEQNMILKIGNNLDCLIRILEYNLRNNILFFRISSDTIPFASHPVCTFDWVEYFKPLIRKIGDFIRENNIRISMHPDQFVLVNAKDGDIVQNSIKELEYHCTLLDAMRLDTTAKVQIHVGGVYGDKQKSMDRFIENYTVLPEFIRKRLVIENDDKSYSLGDCLIISTETDIPVLFDTLHHTCLNNGESHREGIIRSGGTWKEKDGVPMVDYSSQKKEGRMGAHSEHIDPELFRQFIHETKGLDFDIMLEIKDKEQSAIQALGIIKA